MDIKTADRLYEFRKANGYSQEELADKIGVSRQAISKWERSVSSPDTDNLIMLAKLYGVTLDELVNGESVPESKNEGVPLEEPNPEIKNGDVYFHGDDEENNEEYDCLDEEKPLKSFLKNIFSSGKSKNSSYNKNSENSNKTAGLKISSSQISSISINWISGYIVVKQHNSDEIFFKEDYQKNPNYRLRYSINGSTLNIKCCKEGARNLPSKNLTLMLPEKFEAKKLSINGVSAEVNIENITADKLECKTVSGDTCIKGSFIDIDLKGVSGGNNIEASTIFNSLDIKTVSGNSAVKIPSEAKGLNIDSTSVSGTVKLGDLGLPQKEMMVLRGQQHFTFGNGSIQISHTSTSGSVNISMI